MVHDGPTSDREPVVPGASVHVGDVISGKYRIVGVLALGGVGMVLEAVDQKLERTVAIKLLLPLRAKDKTIAARFEKEARTAVKIKSEHVASIIELGELDDGQPFIVLEYLDGDDLAMTIKRMGQLPLQLAVDYTLQACEALAEAHFLGLIHRDLKPANLFIANRPGGTRILKVIDFGLAKTTRFTDDGAPPETVITNTTDVVGTPRYMAPEQLRKDSNLDHRVDIWALGATLYEMLAGRPAFSGHTMSGVWEAILHGEPKPLASLRNDIPQAVDGIIGRCLEKDPTARYASVSELATDLMPFRSPASKHHPIRAKRLESNDGTAEPAGDAAGGSTTLLERLRTTSSQHRKTTARVLLATAALATIVGVTAGTILSWNDVGAPLGSGCEANDECAGSACIDGLCSKRCGSDADCTAPTECLGGLCQRPLRVGFVYVGVPQDQGWTFTHELSRKQLSERLPYLRTTFRTNANRTEDAEKAIDEIVRDGYEVVVANSFTLREAAVRKAKQYPTVKFLVYAPRVDSTANLGAFYANIYHAWYLAGYAAAQKSKSGRLGFVGSLVLPEVVRDINAFARGAQRFNPKAKVEVRWIGFWFDPDGPDAMGRYKEDRLANELGSTGCDVIAHHADNGRVVATLEKRPDGGVLSIGNNSHNACVSGPRTCLGVPHVNWTPLYEKLFGDLHRGRWRPSDLYLQPIRANPEESVVQFVTNANVAGTNTDIRIAELLSELSRDEARNVFAGPLCSTGQRGSCLRKGESVGFDELLSMCWFVEGVIEKADPNIPESEDRPAAVPEECKRNL